MAHEIQFFAREVWAPRGQDHELLIASINLYQKITYLDMTLVISQVFSTWFIILPYKNACS